MTFDADQGSDRPGRPMRAFMQAGFAVVVIGALSLFAWERPIPGAPSSAGQEGGLAVAFVPRAAASVRPPIPLREGGPRYVLDDTREADQARAEPPRFNPANGRREDVLTRGEFPVIETPHLRLTITEGFADHAALFVTLVRRAADGHGLFVARTSERGSILTKFGPVETLETTLRSVSAEGGSRMCTGFVTRPPATVQIDGWLCAPLGQPPEPRAIACALDKLASNGQASTLRNDASGFAKEAIRADTDCDTPTMISSQTESSGGSRTRNEAKVRRTAQARP